MSEGNKSPEVRVNDIDYNWEPWPAQHWRAWGSWFSWGSPIGLGLFFVLVCGGIYILHLAGLVG